MGRVLDFAQLFKINHLVINQKSGRICPGRIVIMPVAGLTRRLGNKIVLQTFKRAAMPF
jgi:hypothetical protein